MFIINLDKFLLKFIIDHNKQKLQLIHLRNLVKHRKSRRFSLDKIRARKPTNISGKNKLNVKRRQEDADIIKMHLKVII